MPPTPLTLSASLHFFLNSLSSDILNHFLCAHVNNFFYFISTSSFTHTWNAMRPDGVKMFVDAYIYREKNMRPSLREGERKIIFPPNLSSSSSLWLYNNDDYAFRDTSPLNRFMFHCEFGWGLKKSSELNSPVYLLLPLVAWNCVVEISEIISFPPFHYIFLFSVIFICIEISLICINFFHPNLNVLFFG